MLERATAWIRGAKAPLIVAGGGVLYSEARVALAAFVEATGIPVAETQAGKGSLPYNHPAQLGAIGVTGTSAANVFAREADLVIAIGTRLSDFTTASKTAFQNPKVRFININVAEIDAYKHSALPVLADARSALEQLAAAQWDAEVERIYGVRHGPQLSQGEVIGALNCFSQPHDVVVCAAGSLPGDLHKLWRTRDPKGYHLEYGYSCMGYEIAGGLGVKMADPSREVYVMVGDGSYLMMSSEIVTSLQEGYKLNIVILDNHGFSSIGGLSQAVGAEGFGTQYRFRSKETGQLDGACIPVDFQANAASFGVPSVRARTYEDLQRALQESRRQDRTNVIVVEVDREMRVPGYESWWDVPVAAVSDDDSVRAIRKKYEEALTRERYFI